MIDTVGQEGSDYYPTVRSHWKIAGHICDDEITHKYLNSMVAETHSEKCKPLRSSTEIEKDISKVSILPYIFVLLVVQILLTSNLYMSSDFQILVT